LNILGQDSSTEYDDIWILDFGVNLQTVDNDGLVTNRMTMPKWYKLTVVGTLPERRYGGRGGVYPMTGLSFWLGLGFNKKEDSGKRLGDSFRITFTNTSTRDDTYQ